MTGPTLAFELNRGQVSGPSSFIARAPGYVLYLAPREIVLARPDGRGAERLEPVGARLHMAPAGDGRLPGVVNVYSGSDSRRWQTGIPTYAAVVYRNIYPGIDLTFNGGRSGMEYDWSLRPGADPSRIRLSVEGRGTLSVDARGDLLAGGHGSELLQRRPFVYVVAQGRRESVWGRFALYGPHIVGFNVGPHDLHHPLVIDPVLVYSTYLGGPGYDEANGIAVDGSGNAYISGYTQDLRFPGANAPRHPVSDDYPDAFVAALDSTGRHLRYSTYLGGSDFDIATAIAVDRRGNVAVTGTTDSSDFPTTSHAWQRRRRGLEDAFITRLDPNGKLLYSSYFGGSRSDNAAAIALDGNGNAYIAGETKSADLPVTATAAQGSLGTPSGFDAFVAEFPARGGVPAYVSYGGGRGDTYAFGVGVDAAGTIDLGTNTSAGVYGGYDARLSVLNPHGGAARSLTLGGGFGDFGTGLAVGGRGTAYLTGYTYSTNFSTTRPFQSGLQSNAFTAFVARIGANLEPIYSTYLGGTRSESRANHIVADAAGDAWVAGWTRASDFPLAHPLQGKNRGGTCGTVPDTYICPDAFVVELSPDGGKLLFGTYLGGSRRDAALSIALGPKRDVYIAGSTDSLNFPMTHGSLQGRSAGSSDAFVARIRPRP